MKKVIVIALFALLFNFKGYSQKDTTPSKKVIDFLDTFRKDYEAMYIEENFRLVQDRYGENVWLMPEFQETVLGLIPSAMYYVAFFERFDIENYRREKIEILDLGSKVIELGRFQTTISDKDGVYNLNGKYQQIWELTNKNTYELVTEAWNYDNWVDLGDHLRFKEVPSVRLALEPHIAVNDNLSFEIAALNGFMEQVIMEADAKRWSMFYTDDGMFIYSFNPIINGRKALDAYFLRHTKELPVFEKLDVRTMAVEELEGYVLEYATAIANWRNGRDSGISTSKNIRIWRREPNGTLKLFRMMAMYD